MISTSWKTGSAAPLTFFRSVADDDLSASLAGLLHRQGGAQALLVLPQALAFSKAILLHDLVGHCASEEEKQEEEMFLHNFLLQTSISNTDILMIKTLSSTLRVWWYKDKREK